MGTKTIIILCLLFINAIVALWLRSFTLYGICMWLLGFVVGLNFLNQDEEQDDDNS